MDDLGRTVMGNTVGIDLGTTYSSVAYVNRLGKSEIIVNRDGDRLTPSVVMFQDALPDQPLVGKMAKNSAAISPLNVVDYVKRHMGDRDWRFHGPDDTEYGAEDISAIILKRLVEDAQLQLGMSSPITDVVITVPAYFDDARRKATQDAGEIAGLRVKRIINEPTAAALAYGIDLEIPQTLLVYDLGGGTFDVTLVSIADGGFVVEGTDGNRNLGGFDWDNRIMTWLNERFVEAGGSDLLDSGLREVELRQKSESAKRSLTTVDSTVVVLGAGDFVHSERLTRVAFEEMTHDLLETTGDLVQKLLLDVGSSWQDVDRILLVGGSTRMPQVRAWLEQQSGIEPEYGTNPDEMVALGAALQAHIVASEEDNSPESDVSLRADGLPVRVRDVTSQSLGIVVLNEANEKRNHIMINRNSEIPTSKRDVFRTVGDKQTVILVTVTEGDGTDVDFVTEIGAAEISFPPYPQGSAVECEYAYDIDQTIFIRVFDPQDQGQLVGQFSVDRQANLSPNEVALRAESMKGLSVQ